MIFNFAIACFVAATAAVPTQRSITCQFPTDQGLVPVTPNDSNAGWAMSPNQPCTAGSYCPYACPPGQVMAQWDPSATSYTYPKSMNGGLYCNSDGSTTKPFPNMPLCVDGEKTVKVQNQANSNVSFCQTVLPGNEAMLIPTSIEAGSSEIISVPGISYWAGTASHFYINAPGVSTEEGCVWGTDAKPVGNWAPYVAGANTDSNGNTFVKIGWNPIYIDSYKNVLPSFGIRITCEDESKCNGLSCEIDPSKHGFNGVSGPSSDISLEAGFCIVTAEQMNSATIEVFSI
jgi:hypothetical protein